MGEIVFRNIRTRDFCVDPKPMFSKCWICNFIYAIYIRAMIYAIWPGNMCYAEAFHIVAAQQHPSRHQTDKNFCHADGKKRSFRISCAWTPNACLQNVGSVIKFMQSAYAI